MVDPALSELISPTLKIQDVEYTFELRPRDVAILKQKFDVDLMKNDTSGPQGIERLAAILCVASHDPSMTLDFVMDNFRLGQITRVGTAVLKNASPEAALPNPQA